MIPIIIMDEDISAEFGNIF